MRRQSNDTTALVYAYGCGEPTAGLDAALSEHERQVELWDRLVQIERDYRASVRAAAVPDIDARIAELNAQITEQVAERRRLRQDARSRIETPELDKAITALVTDRRERYREASTGIRAWRATKPVEAKALGDARREATPRCATSPLYWGNYNRVRDDFRAACDRPGPPPRFRDPRREDGVLAVQIQRTGSGLGAAPGELQDGTFSGLQIGAVDPRAWDPGTFRGARRRLRRTTVEMRIDRAGNTIRMPMWMHRPLPEGCRVKAAQVTWRREGGRLRWQIALTVSLPLVEVEHAGNTAVGVDLGWRLEPDRSLLVATLRDSAGSEERYHLDRRWMESMDHVERLATTIDAALLEIARWVQDTPRTAGTLAVEACRRWRPGLGARHVDVPMLEAAGYGGCARLREWRREHMRLSRERDGLRARLLRRRREIYRLAARGIAMRYALIGLEDMDLSQISRTRTRTDERPELHAAARAQRVRACVHELRREIRHQATKHGARVVPIGGPSTMLCAQCGEVTGQRDRTAVHWACEHCAAVWDQDRNAALNLLRAAEHGASGPVAERQEGRKSTGYVRKSGPKEQRSQTPMDSQ